MQVRTTSDLGALIRDRRVQLAWSQNELATRVGVRRLWIVQLEKGKTTAQIGLVLRAMKELGLALNTSVPDVAASDRKQSGAIDLNQIIQGKRSSRL